MLYTPLLHKAFHFAIAVHEVNQQQKRKGKQIAYITHPLHVGFILAKAGASDEVIAAGFLHDSIEDCEPHGSVTKEMLAAMFGDKVAELVDSVTEKDKGLSWHERKDAALEEIRYFSHESLMLKAGDVISNTNELAYDFEREGNDTFLRFNSPREEMVHHAKLVIETIVAAWPENPLAADLAHCVTQLEKMA